MHVLKLQPPAECSNHSGSMAVQFALLMAGTNGKRKAYVKSHRLKSEGRMVQGRQYSKLLTSECQASYQFSVSSWPAMRELSVNQDKQIAAARESGNQIAKRHGQKLLNEVAFRFTGYVGLGGVAAFIS